ncbi:MAG: signal peptidase I [Thermodesulfobacteriota bacterium]
MESSYNSLKNYHKETLNKFTKSKLRQNIEAILIALCLALLIRTFIVQPFKIPSGSMIPTLLIGDHLLVNKFIYGTRIPFTNIKFLPLEEIQRGDVIVFKFPVEDSVNKGVHYIKRVIGLPGDEINIKGRDVYINGEKVKQVFDGNYIYDENGIEIKTDKYIATLPDNEFDVIYKDGSLNTTKGKLNFPITIPDGKIFVLGDNRDNSYDSRFWGFVPLASISGKAFLIHWSWNFDQSNIFKKVRWDRVFSKIN